METITDPNSYLFNPAVVAADWVAFFVLSGTALVIGYRLTQFKGPSEQPEDYYFGYGKLCAIDLLVLMPATSYPGFRYLIFKLWGESRADIERLECSQSL